VSADNKGIPGWAELLTHAADYGTPASREELKRLAQAASNNIGSILDGLAAIGELQWRAAQYTDDPFPPQALHMLGDFQLTLADLLSRLRSIEGDANFWRHELELTEAKGEAMA
jgi:hypothetical protein